MERDKLPGLQIARAMAALIIAYFHSWHVTRNFTPDTAYPIPLLKDYGFLAVDFFFAISGYVICMVVTKPGFRPINFLIRRAFRLYPLWIATSVAYIFIAKYIVGMAPRDTPAFILYSFTLLPTDGLPFYNLGWSLQHEVCFYLLAALVTPWFGLRGLLLILAAGTVIGKMFDLPWYASQLTSYYPNFIAGILAFIVHGRFERMSSFGLITCGALLLSALIALNAAAAYPLAMFLLLLGFVNLTTRAGSLAERIGVTIGDASYSIYLFHAIIFFAIYGALRPPLPPDWTQEFIRFGAIVAICALAVVSWKLFETPFNRLGARLANRVAGFRTKALATANDWRAR